MELINKICYISNGENMKKMLDKIKKTKTKKEIVKKFTNKEVVFLIIVTSIISLFFGLVINSNKKNAKETDETLKEFVNTYNDILNNYYGDVDKKELLSGAVNGMLSKLDEYTTLIDTSTNEAFYLTLEGSYNGIGIEISNDINKNIIIVGTLENSPAETSGLKAGDIIKKIDDKDLIGKEFSTLSKYIRNNSEKTKYNLVVERDGEEKTFEIEKKKVTIKSVSSKIIEKEGHKIGYIYISIFSNETAKQFKKALNDLKEQEIDSIIFDVRENTGGHLTTVVSMLSELLNREHVIYQIEKDKKKMEYYSLGAKDIEYPIVVIQNSNSASASELFSISLKENLGATIVGENSYGKGTVQELNYLSNGDSYKYTTKKWLSPKGKWINKVGVEPTIKVSLDENYMNNPCDENDNQLQAAINELIK